MKEKARSDGTRFICKLIGTAVILQEKYEYTGGAVTNRQFYIVVRYSVAFKKEMPVFLLYPYFLHLLSLPHRVCVIVCDLFIRSVVLPVGRARRRAGPGAVVIAVVPGARAGSGPVT